MRSVTRWFTNLHVQDVMPVMSVKPLDILAPGFVSTYPRIIIPISINIFRLLSRVRIYVLSIVFSILDSALINFQLQVKEALHNEWEQHALNKQLKHVNLTLSRKLLFVFNIFYSFVLAPFIFPLRCIPLVSCNLFSLICSYYSTVCNLHLLFTYFI